MALLYYLSEHKYSKGQVICFLSYIKFVIYNWIKSHNIWKFKKNPEGVTYNIPPKNRLLEINWNLNMVKDIQRVKY